MPTRMIAALFVIRNGPYSWVDGVDIWDRSRDARKYGGPFPVVAHPPCERWGRYSSGGPLGMKTGRYVPGQDGGCFLSALQSVRAFGGVLEHPEGSLAWKWFGFNKPPKNGGWVQADIYGWTCSVEQGNYGHKARKATWLYACHVELPRLKWGESIASMKIDGSRGARLPEMAKSFRHVTPKPFRDLLISIARSAR